MHKPLTKPIRESEINIDGVLVQKLGMHVDDRGTFTEIYRKEWDTGIRPIQWNCVKSNSGVLRGFHVHVKHFDYLSVVHGQASVALKDLRPGSPTEGNCTILDMCGDAQSTVTIPPGVGHAFYFHQFSMHIYAVSEYWNLDDELGCHWADPELNIPWPFTSARISKRDKELDSFAALKQTLAKRWKFPTAS